MCKVTLLMNSFIFFMYVSCFLFSDFWLSNNCLFINNVKETQSINNPIIQVYITLTKSK